MVSGVFGKGLGPVVFTLLGGFLLESIGTTWTFLFLALVNFCFMLMWLFCEWRESRSLVLGKPTVCIRDDQRIESQANTITR